MGLGRAIRERHGSRPVAIAALPMALTDFMTYVVEFAGIALGARLLGISPALTVAAAFLVYAMIVATKRYRVAEAVLLPVSFMLVAAIVVSVAFFPIDPGSLLLEGLSPIQPYLSPGYGFLLAASIGAVIMPWMLFFHSGADARKGLSRADLPAERIETLVGAIVSEVLMAITVIDGYGLRLFDGTPTLSISPSEIANLLHPLGPLSSLIMGIGFVAAGFLALTVASMASGWGVSGSSGLGLQENRARVLSDNGHRGRVRGHPRDKPRVADAGSDGSLHDSDTAFPLLPGEARLRSSGHEGPSSEIVGEDRLLDDGRARLRRRARRDNTITGIILSL
ncbi:MAG: divalent metal cation transporter [Conexivisphaera sp.]|jgi:Mn2+/Fe2+ NRAMP family transporter